MSLVISVVLPDPLQPARPTMRMLMAGMIGTPGVYCDTRHDRETHRPPRAEMPASALAHPQGADFVRSGDILVVQCTDPLATIDIPTMVGKTGDVIEETRHEEGVTTFRIRKR